MELFVVFGFGCVVSDGIVGVGGNYVLAGFDVVFVFFGDGVVVVDWFDFGCVGGIVFWWLVGLCYVGGVGVVVGFVVFFVGIGVGVVVFGVIGCFVGGWVY